MALFLFFLAKAMKPVLYTLHIITHPINMLVGGSSRKEVSIFTREEIQKLLETTQHEDPQQTEGEDINAIVANIFSLRRKKAKDVMEPLITVPLVPSNCTVAHMRHIMKGSWQDLLLIYHRHRKHIVGIAYPRDLLRASDSKRVHDYSRPPWFITKDTSVLKILEQFRQNNQDLAIVLNKQGSAEGVLTLDLIIQEIFGKIPLASFSEKTGIPAGTRKTKQLVDRTINGDMTVEEFSKEFQMVLDAPQKQTISQMITENLGHQPETGEAIFLDPLVLTVKETALLGAKVVQVKTRL